MRVLRRTVFWIAGVPAAVIALACSVSVCAAIEVFGTDMQADANTAATELANKIIGMVNLFAGFVGVVLFTVMVYAGFKLMTTGDNPEGNSKAKAMLMYGVSGAALVFFAWILARAVVGKLSAGA